MEHFWIFESTTFTRNAESLVIRLLDDGEVEFKMGNKECVIDQDQVKNLIERLRKSK